MTRRAIILGIVLILVVMYGAWDTIQNRSRRHSARRLDSKATATTAAGPVLENVQNDASTASSPLPGGDAPATKRKPGQGVEASTFKISLPKLPRVACLTQLQRQRVKDDWGRDPFIRAGLGNQDGGPGTPVSYPVLIDEAQVLVLKGVVRFGARFIAIINDKTYLPGDLVDGWRVEKIDPDRVIMQKGEEQMTLVIDRLQDVR